MDVLTPDQRSYNMSRIRSVNTQPEIKIFTELDKLEKGYKKHYSIPGKPDIVFPEKKIAVFIDGEFWHGRYLRKIKTRLSDYWIKKITNNIKRDKKIRNQLKKEGWIVLRLWGDDIEKNLEKEFSKILKIL